MEINRITKASRFRLWRITNWHTHWRRETNGKYLQKEIGIINMSGKKEASHMDEDGN